MSSSNPIQQYEREPSTFARRFFWLSLVVFGTGFLMARMLVWLCGSRLPSWGYFPPAFVVSTGLLAAGSFELQRALQAVRVEKTERFRRSLLFGLVIGTLFVGMQTFGLWSLITQRRPDDSSTGVNAFVVMLAAVHGLHFIVALLFLAYVTVKGFAARYDHEYFWGVQVCAWFWHALGVLWLAISVVLVIATSWQELPGP